MFHETQGWRVGRIAGVEVSISFGYVFLIGWIVLKGLGGGSLGFAQGLSTAAMITLSVLIHEMGHAMVSKYYKLRPSVLLHGFGGVCLHDEASSDGRDALIVLAGPIIQIIAGIAALVFGALVALPGSLGNVVSTFALFSIVWGGANLILPLWPLDGGKLFHLILRRVVSERRARQVTLWVSMTLAVVGGVLGAVNGHIFLAFIALFILMDNWSALQADVPLVNRSGKAAAAAKTAGPARELLTQAEQAFAVGEWRDAARLCHQARATRGVMGERDSARMWELLALSALELGDLDEARDFIRLAPPTPAVQAAQRRLDA
jgi:stage IV sporulation protein FB